MKAFSRAEWERANRSLAAALQLAATEPNSAASRAYYAVFHAVTALFALRGQTYKRHSAVRSALYRDLIHAGQLSVEMGRIYDAVMDLRDTGDYGGLTQVTADNARAAVQKAQIFIEAIRQVCPQLDEPS